MAIFSQIPRGGMIKSPNFQQNVGIKMTFFQNFFSFPKIQLFFNVIQAIDLCGTFFPGKLCTKYLFFVFLAFLQSLTPTIFFSIFDHFSKRLLEFKNNPFSTHFKQKN